MTQPVDPRLIYLVASRYREMQGLVTVSDAMFPVMMASILFISSNDTVLLWYLVGCLACFVASMIWLRPRLLAYYTARFGRISSGFPSPVAMLMFQGLTMGSILADMHLPVVARYLAIFLLLGGWPARIVVRDWPYRGYWGLPLAVALGAAFPLASRPVAETTMAVWASATGIAVAIAGWCDHALLARTLTGARRADAAASEEPTR